MVNISENGIIAMNAGDYLDLPIFINAGNYANPLRYILEENDKLYISIMEPNQPFEAGIVRKILTKDNLNIFGDAELILDNTDTENIIPGNYYYEIKLSINKNNKDYVSTIVPKRRLYIIGE